MCRPVPLFDVERQVLLSRLYCTRITHDYMFMNTVPSARYSEYEIIQHQKEELEMQNKRMVERISKLQFIYKGN